MKKQLFKGLLAFYIVVFSYFSSSAQCPGNKVLVCTQQGRAEPTWICKCVPKSQAKSYFQNGWTLSTPSGAAKISGVNSTAISLELIESQNVSLKIYDITGRLIKTIAACKMSEGYHQIEWNARDEGGNAVSPGIYILQFDADAYYSDTKKLSVIN